MDFAVLSGAYKNAGDFLIVDRLIKLLHYVYPDCSVILYDRGKSLDEKKEEINKKDALIIGGGPAYCVDLYPDLLPLVRDLDGITIPFVIVGGGWYGRNGSDKVVYEEYKFTPLTSQLINRLSHDGFLGCRDWYSVRALKANGFKKTMMTGCPAWYSLEHINQLGLREDVCFPPKKICISDCGNRRNLQASLALVRYVRGKFPNADIMYVFHRGVTQDKYTHPKDAIFYTRAQGKLKKIGVSVVDISYSADGFHVYDDCDFHIGMRVHAHIYNLSIRNPSILIEEDGRGAGVNDALGLPHIKAYASNHFYDSIAPIGNSYWSKKIRRSLQGTIRENCCNKYLLHELDDYFFMLEQDNFYKVRKAFEMQRHYFDVMLQHISSIVTH